MPGVAGPSGSVGSRIVTSPRRVGTVEGCVDPDASCSPSVKRPCGTGEVRGGVPAMPTLVPAELNMRLEERHADLRDALLQGDSNRALELTVKLSDECAGQAM